VPKGLVEDQKLVNGKTPCLPHSRTIREAPKVEEVMFPNALSAIRKFSPLTRLLSPRTLVNHKLAVVREECSKSYFETPAYQETLVNI
jgi:hypothetical protein